MIKQITKVLGALAILGIAIAQQTQYQSMGRLPENVAFSQQLPQGRKLQARHLNDVPTPPTYGRALSERETAPTYGRALSEREPAPTYGRALSERHAAPTYGRALSERDAAPTYGRALSEREAPTYGRALSEREAAPTYGRALSEREATPTYGRTLSESEKAPTYGRSLSESEEAPTYGRSLSESEEAPTYGRSLSEREKAPTYGRSLVEVQPEQITVEDDKVAVEDTVIEADDKSDEAANDEAANDEAANDASVDAIQASQTYGWKVIFSFDVAGLTTTQVRQWSPQDMAQMQSSLSNAIAASEDFTDVTGGYLTTAGTQNGVKFVAYVTYPGDFSEVEVRSMFSDNFVEAFPTHFDATFDGLHASIDARQSVTADLIMLGDQIQHEYNEIVGDADTLKITSHRESSHLAIAGTLVGCALVGGLIASAAIIVSMEQRRRELAANASAITEQLLA